MPQIVFISKQGLSIFTKMQVHNHKLFFFIFQPVSVFFGGTDDIFAACDAVGQSRKRIGTVLFDEVEHLQCRLRAGKTAGVDDIFHIFSYFFLMWLKPIAKQTISPRMTAKALLGPMAAAELAMPKLWANAVPTNKPMM